MARAIVERGKTLSGRKDPVEHHAARQDRKWGRRRRGCCATQPTALETLGDHPLRPRSGIEVEDDG